MDVKTRCLILIALSAGLTCWTSAQAEPFTTPNGTVIDRTFGGPNRPRDNIAVCTDEQFAKLADVRIFAANYLYDLEYNIVDIGTVSDDELDDYTLVYIGTDPSNGTAPSCLPKRAKLLEFAQSDAKGMREPKAGLPQGMPAGSMPLSSTSYHAGDDPGEIAFITSICDVDRAGEDECRAQSVPAIFLLNYWEVQWDFSQQNGD